MKTPVNETCNYLFMNKQLLWLYAALALSLYLLAFSGAYNPLSWDVLGYYLYLPAGFIYNDLFLTDMSWLEAVNQQYNSTDTFYQLVEQEGGKKITKYACGWALLALPFFLIAHLIALLFELPADGFSPVYQYAVNFGAVTYAVIGLYFFIKILNKFFSTKVTALTVLIIVFGTNYLHLSSYDATLQHSHIFFLFAVLIYTSFLFLQRPSFFKAVVIGLCTGLIFITRPSDIMIVIFPVIYSFLYFNRFDDWKKFILENSRYILMIVLFALLAVFPQLLYWKTGTGSWLYYSYQNAGEGLDLFSPHTIEFLFSFRKGWYVYTPVMLLVTASFVLLYKENKKLFYPVFFYFIINLWIISSWTTWWYAGGSFSQRAVMPAYVLLSFPAAYMVRYILRLSNKILKTGAFALIVLLILLNLFQTWQFKNGIISSERMTYEYYTAVFGKTHVPDGAEDLLSIDRGTSGVEKFTDDDRYKETTVKEFEKEVIMTTEEQPFFDLFSEPFEQFVSKDHAWLIIEVDVVVPDTSKYPLIVAVTQYQGKDYHYRTNETRKKEINGDTLSMRLDYVTPHVRTTRDNIKVYLWQRHNEEAKVIDYSIKKMEPK